MLQNLTQLTFSSPYWMHCGNDDYIFGIFDPPGAVPPVVGLLPTTVAVPVISTNDPASPLPTAASDQAASTTPAAAPASSGTSQHSLVPLVIPSAPLLADHAAPASTPTNPTDPLTSGTHTFTLISFTEGDLETVTYSSWFTKEPGATFPIVVQPAESTLSAPQISANMVFIHPADTSTSTSTDPAATPPLAVPSLSGVNPLLLSSPLSMLSRKISTITYEGVGTLPINIQTAESTLAVPQISADAAFIFPADISTLANPVSTLTPADPVNSGTNSFSVITIGFQIEATGLAFPTVLPLGMISTLADLSSLSDPVNPGTIPTASGNTIGYQTAATQLTLPDVPFASALADPSPLSDTVSIPYPADPSAPGMTPLSKNLLIPTSLPIGKPIYAQSAESSLAAAIATYLSNLADASITVDPASTPSPAAPSNPADPALPGKTPSPPTSRNLSNSPEPSNYPGFVQPAANLLVPEPSSSENPTTDTTPPVSNPPITTPSILLPTSAIAIAIIGTQTLSAIPGSSGVVLPNGSTATPGSVATVTDANSQPIVVSVGSSGIYIGGTSSGDSTSYVANPTIPPVAIATIGDEVLSAAPGASNVVIGSQTASLGDDAITVGGSIIQLTPSGVVVNDGSGGPAQTYAIPTPAAALSPIATVAGQVISAAPGATNIVVGSQTASLGGSPITVAGSVIQLTPSGVVVNDGSGGASTYTIPTVAAAPTPIATIGGQVISAAPGASTILVGGQTLTAGGVPVTLSGSNNVASLGPSGLVVQYPGGSVSSFARPTAAPSAEALIGTIAGLSFSVPASASVISIGSQGVTLGGSPVTVSNDVVSLGPSGLAIQLPGGGVSTIAPEAVTSTSSGKGIASIIASSTSSLPFDDDHGTNSGILVAGASQTGTTTRTGSASGSSSTALSSSPVVTKSAASRVAIGLMGDLASWAVVCLMLGFVLV